MAEKTMRLVISGDGLFKNIHQMASAKPMNHTFLHNIHVSISTAAQAYLTLSQANIA